MVREGYKHSEETKRKIGLKSKGRIPSREVRKKMRMARLGKPLSKEVRKNISIGHIGINNWMSGRKLSEETKRKMSESRKGHKGYMLNKKHLEESKKKISEYMKKHKKTEKHINNLKKARAKQILPVKDTTIEVKLQEYLKVLGIEFYTHQYIKEIEHGYQCDIFIPIQKGIDRPMVIEAFGVYWHNYPYGKPLDSIRCQELRRAGFRVLVFWENEIKAMELKDLKNELLLKNERWLMK